MNRYIIMNGLPYLYAAGKAYAVRWNEQGFTVGAEVEMKEAPTKTYNELSIKAQCAGDLDSIKAEPEKAAEEQAEPEKAAEEQAEPEKAATKKPVARKTAGRKTAKK